MDKVKRIDNHIYRLEYWTRGLKEAREKAKELRDWATSVRIIKDSDDGYGIYVKDKYS